MLRFNCLDLVAGRIESPPSYEASNKAYSRSNSETVIPPSYAPQPRFNEISMSTSSLPAAKHTVSYHPSTRHHSESHLPHAHASTSLSGTGAIGLAGASSSEVDMDNKRNLSRENEKMTKKRCYDNSTYSINDDYM